MIYDMKQKKFIKLFSLAALLVLACLALTSCGKTKEPADVGQFRSACENDGLTASAIQADDPAGEVIEYAAYGHGQDDVLVQFYQFEDETTAQKWYLSACENAQAGPSATTYEMKGNNFNSYTVTADRAYTVVTQVENTLAVATGPLTFKSSLDRILLSIGYLSSNL